MPTSTLISYSIQATQYAWDSVIGFLGAGGFNFYVVIGIVIGVLCLGIAAIKGIFA